jgi:hypothetical protein
MGAYENPPMISSATTGAGQAWANAAAAAGKNIGDAIIARRKKLEERLKKDNEDLLKRNKIGADIANKAPGEIQKILDRLGPLPDVIKNTIVTGLKDGYKVYEKYMSSGDIEEQKKLQPALDQFNSLRNNIITTPSDANEYYISITKELDQVRNGEIGVEGTVDQFDTRNNPALFAADIENFGITGKESRTGKFNEKGQLVLDYTDMNGNPFSINLNDPPPTRKVPKISAQFQALVDKTDVYAGEGKDKSISTDYMAVDATGKPKMVYEFEDIEADPLGRKRQIIRKGPEVRNNDIEQVYIDLISDLDYTNDEQLSVFKNILVDSMSKKDIEAINNSLKKAEKNIQFKSQDELFKFFTYPKEGSAKFDDDQQLIYNMVASVWAGNKAKNDVASITKKLGGSETIVTYPKKDMSASVQNAIDGFKLLESGEITNLGVSGGYIAKTGNKYTYYRNTTSGPITVLENVSLAQAVRMVDNIPQSEVIAGLSDPYGSRDPLNPNE